jgi:Cytochrome c554 and c-prime
VPRLALALSVALGILAGGSAPFAGDLPPLPGRPARGPVGQGSGGCAGCHQEIAAEWRASLHHQAWSDPVFQKAYGVEPLAFCRGCHAPESNSKGEPDEAAATTGVGCTTCHVENGHVVAAHEASAPHPVFADARLATAAACAACHEFNFPKESGQKVAQPMQDTVREHGRSSARATACQGCHMPEVVGTEGRHKSHAFSVIADPSMIRRAAAITAERLSPTSIAVALAPAGAGHSFPTGDMFRRLEVRAEAVGAPAHAAPVVLARTFKDIPRSEDELGFQRVQASDHRIPPPGVGPGRRVVMELPGAARGLPIRYQVAYQRMAAPMAHAFDVDEVLDEIIVAEGTVTP